MHNIFSKKVLCFFCLFFILIAFQNRSQAQKNSLDLERLINQAYLLSEHYPDSAFKIAGKIIAQESNYTKKENSINAHLIKGNILKNYGLYLQAKEQYNQSLKLLNNDTNTTLFATILTQIGDIYFQTKNPKLAYEYYIKAKKKYSELTDSIGLASTYTKLGHYYEKSNDYEKAISYQKQALSIYEYLKDSSGLTTVHINIGSVYEDLAEYDLAKEQFEMALIFNKVNNNIQQQIIILNNLGDYYRKTNKSKESVPFYKETISLAKSIQNPYQKQSALKDLAHSYANLKKYELAFWTIDTVLDYYKNTNTNYINQQITSIDALYQLKEHENKINILEKNKIINTSRNYLAVAIICILMLLIITILILYKNNIKRKENEAKLKLQQYQAQLDLIEKSEEHLKNELELKNKTLTSYALQTVQDKKVLKDLYDQLKQIKKSPAKDRDEFLKTALADLKSTLQEENHWEEFKLFFETVHPQFIPNLQKIDASLSSAEIRLAVLLKMNMRSKDMATILRISPDSVRIARYRLRKKLPIEKGEDLIQYILNI